MVQVCSPLQQQDTPKNSTTSLRAVPGEGFPPKKPRHDLFHSSGCGYHIFAGKECSRALALMSLKPEDCNSKLTDLDESKIKVLNDWQKVCSVSS